jgi:hypothetical protein
MTKDFGGTGRDQILMYYPGIHLKGLRKTMKNLCRDIWFLADIQTRDLMNTKKQCYPLDHDIRCSVLTAVISFKK